MYVLLLLLFGASFTKSLRDQSVGVRGMLKCGNKPLNGTTVKLWDEDRGLDHDELLDESVTDSRGYFELNGHTSELTNIDPFIKVYHDCNDELKPCKRKVRFKVPDKFISNGKTVMKWFELGEINMEAVYEDEGRSCTD
ncbi:Transthyretin-like protein 46 [Toxocara canis]|uniref:Transthyretin-like protein 46 n=2 Tax=Ascaridoidea TaxID=33256 RepID=A0A0B2V1F5_TOXCA|nr:Transthyretin-like protein 46 [Toxocara canis]